jgi:hypothetical protein
MKNLINNKRKTLSESFSFDMISEEQSESLHGGQKSEKDLFDDNINPENIWHKATSILDDLI